MEEKAKQQLGELLVDQAKLLDILAKNTAALDSYPELQLHLLDKSERSIAYRRALRNKQFSRDEYLDAVLLRIDDLGYDICMNLELDFLVNRVASVVGDDIDAIQQLNIKDFGADNLSKLLHMMGNSVYTSQEMRVSYPFLATKGQVAFSFWRRAHHAFDLYRQGYQSHWKLNAVFKEQFDTAVPQSATRFFKQHGDPRLIPEWVEWSGYQDADP